MGMAAALRVRRHCSPRTVHWIAGMLALLATATDSFGQAARLRFSIPSQPLAAGLLQLGHVDRLIGMRGEIDAHYRRRLASVPGITPHSPHPEATRNFAYFPILVGEDYPLGRDGLYDRFRSNAILARRYFYPLISQFPMYRGLASAQRDNLPVASRLADQVLCLPIFPDLALETVDRIVDIIEAR